VTPVEAIFVVVFATAVLWLLLAPVSPWAVRLPSRSTRRRLPSSRPSRWRAVTVPAQQYRADYYFHGASEIVPVRGEIAVRVARRGEFLSIGTVEVDDDDFDPKLDALVARAEARANTMNATEEILSGSA